MQTALSSKIEDRILDLWFHRRDVGVQQYWNKTTGRGGYGKVCEHQPPGRYEPCAFRKPNVTCGKCGDFKALPITSQLVRGHLQGGYTLGAYQLGQDGATVKWTCLDFDQIETGTEQELQDAALIAKLSLESLHLPAYFESSGGSGWRCHVWTFFSGPVPAIKAKVVLDAALRQAELHEKPFIERFPKQSRALNGYGNLVKLPFGIHRKSGKHSMFLDDNLNPITSTETALGTIEPVDPMVLDMVIDLKALTLDDAPSATVNAPATKFDYPSDAMGKILTNCWYFREVERQQADAETNVHYEDWWNYLLMFVRFGDAGANRILTLSQQDPRFDFEYTVTLINYLRANGYHAPSCRRLRTGPGQIRCPFDPLECGAANG